MWINLGRILDKKGITLYKFAKELGVPASTVTTYFRPGYDPRLSSVLRWCEVLDVGIDDLIDPRVKIGMIPRPQSAKEADQSKNPKFKARVKRNKR